MVHVISLAGLIRREATTSVSPSDGHLDQQPVAKSLLCSKPTVLAFWDATTREVHAHVVIPFTRAWLVRTLFALVA